MNPTQIGRIVCQYICRSGYKCWIEMGVKVVHVSNICLYYPEVRVLIESAIQAQHLF
jgi:hypothetical protein